MRTKVNDMITLDEDLNLFEEDEWDFLNVGIEEENSEFFNDIKDIDFLDKHSALKTLVPVGVLGLLVLVCGLWLLNIVSTRQDMKYDAYKKSVDAGSNIQYVDGKEVSSDKLISISKSIQGYIKDMNTGNFNNLSSYCVGKSTLAQNYNLELGQMKSALDSHDGYARMMKVLSEDIHCNKIEKAIEKDGVIYVYTRLNVPDKDSINEYVNLYKYNMTKFFTNKEVNEQNINTFLIETSKTESIPCHEQLYVLEVDDSNKLIDDTKMLGIISEAYGHCISKMTTILGAGGITG